MTRPAGYKRHGTTTLFAALDVKSGTVIGDCMPRHRAKEFLKFLRQIDKAMPARRDVHLVLNNYATHKTSEVKAWLHKHPRFKLHFTPTSASWLNLVERFFAEITSRRIRRGSYPRSGSCVYIVALIAAVQHRPKTVDSGEKLWPCLGEGRQAKQPSSGNSPQN